ncbi:uncharacterized protein RHO25_002121 [Cercospora beticola]|nr:hypothetical protein RHO25_002121 [Cercospora beticola]
MDERFRWAASRKTKRIEDKAYCLLGLFEVYIPPIYGEGGHAFERLKTAIRQKLRCLAKDSSTADQNVNETLSKHRQTVLDSLRFQELGARQAILKDAHKSTCEWILEHPEYAKWSHSDCGAFWIVGKPGAGKSTLMKFIYSKADKAKSEHEFVFGFFFNARGNTLERTTNGLYQALAFELLSAFPKLQNALDGKRSPTEWTLHSLKHLLSRIIQRMGPRTLKFFIDALDECDEQEIKDMVEHMEEIEDDVSLGGGMLSICFASRHYPSITIRNGVRLNLDQETGHMNDLNIYIGQRLQMKGEGTLVHKICEEVRRKSNGVFLWTVLVVDILNKEIRRGRMRYIKSKLDEIPSGLSALFLETLVRDKDEMEEFHLCIQWILFAQRPLRIDEFYFAMDSGMQNHSSGGAVWQPEPWDRESVTIDQIKRYVQTSSKGLAEVVPPILPWRMEEATVQFIHESVRDFFLRDGHLADLLSISRDQARTHSHEKLKNCCLNYLAADTSAVRGDHGLDQYPFLRYASINILYHANEAADEVAQDRLFDMYPNEHYIDFAWPQWLADGDSMIPGSAYPHTSNVTILYLAAERNLVRLIAIAIEKGYDIWHQLQREEYQYAVLVAFVHGHRDALAVLLGDLPVASVEDIARDPGFGKMDHKYDFDDIHRGVLVWASERGNWALAENLTRVNAPSSILLGDRWTGIRGKHAITMSSYIGRLQVLEYLLENVPWFHAGDALIAAVCQDQTAVVQRILGHCHDLSGRDLSTRKIIYYDFPASYGRSVTKELKGTLLAGLRLRDRGCRDMNPWEDYTIRALQLAIIKGHLQVVQLLIDHGVNVNSNCRPKCYSLQIASALRNTAIVRLLLDSGADITGRSPPYGSALQAASATGQTDTVHLLLERCADVNATSAEFQPALHFAASGGHTRVVHALLDAGANINAISRKSHTTALHVASDLGHRDVVQTLLDRGADAYGDEEVGCALWAASKRGNTAIVKLLLERGDCGNATAPQDWLWQHALSIAASSGHRDAIVLLLDRGADVNAYCKDDGLALHAACSSGSYKTVKLLLDRGADVNAYNEDGGTALHAACSRGIYEVVKLLLDRGANINNDSGPKNSLQTACTSSLDNVAVVHLLMSRGARGNYQRCLVEVSRSDHMMNVQLLLSLGGLIPAQWLREALEAAPPDHSKLMPLVRTTPSLNEILFEALRNTKSAKQDSSASNGVEERSMSNFDYIAPTN